MIKNILTDMDGVSIYGVISICIFFSFFTGMLLWAFLRKKNYLNHMAAVPLDGGEKNSCAIGTPVSDPARFQSVRQRAGSETGAPLNSEKNPLKKNL